MSDQTPTEQKPTVAARPGVMSLSIKEKAGLFIPTSKPYKIGEEVFMLLSLLDEPNKLKVVGRVAWVTPVSQGGRPQGIGVQFTGEDGGLEVRNKIEALLGGAMKSTRSTHTI